MAGKRLLTKLNYLIHTDTVKEYLVPVELSSKQKSYIYANEADLLNVLCLEKLQNNGEMKTRARKGMLGITQAQSNWRF